MYESFRKIFSWKIQQKIYKSRIMQKQDKLLIRQMVSSPDVEQGLFLSKVLHTLLMLYFILTKFKRKTFVKVPFQ